MLKTPAEIKESSPLTGGDLDVNTPRKLYSLMALYEGPPRRNPFQKTKYSASRMSGGFIGQKIFNGKQRALLVPA